MKFKQNMKKIYAFLWCLFVTSGMYATDGITMLAVSSDGNDAFYFLPEVQRIEVSERGEEPFMIVLSKDGNRKSNVQRILFDRVQTEIAGIGVVSVYVYPNPVAHTLYIQGLTEPAHLAVYNLGGKCYMQEKGTEIDVTALQQGTYILSVNQQYVKFIKK
jgi:hypothetical protein